MNIEKWGWDSSYEENSGGLFLLYGTGQPLGVNTQLSSIARKNAGDGSKGVLITHQQRAIYGASSLLQDVDGDDFDDIIVGSVIGTNPASYAINVIYGSDRFGKLD